MRLQEFGFRKSAYERPTQDWVCGRGFHDEACEVGPARTNTLSNTSSGEPFSIS